MCVCECVYIHVCVRMCVYVCVCACMHVLVCGERDTIRCDVMLYRSHTGEGGREGGREEGREEHLICVQRWYVPENLFAPYTLNTSVLIH